jgi:hypothetical protein
MSSSSPAAPIRIAQWLEPRRLTMSADGRATDPRVSRKPSTPNVLADDD